MAQRHQRQHERDQRAGHRQRQQVDTVAQVGQHERIAAERWREQPRQRRDHGHRRHACRHFQRRHRQCVPVFDQPFVQRTEQRDKQCGECAHHHADQHAVGHAAGDQRHAGQHRYAQPDLAFRQSLPGEPRFDQRREHRAQCHAGGADRCIGEFDRGIERQPVQRDQHTHTGVAPAQTRRHRAQPAPHPGQQHQQRHHQQHPPPHQRQCREADELA